MTFYQELQLNQAGSKAVIRNCTDKKEKLRHIAIYLFKIFITMVFCMAVVIGFSKIFGNDNSIVGVVVLLCVMAFRFADSDLWSTSGKCRRTGPGVSCEHGLYFDFDGTWLPQCGDV